MNSSKPEKQAKQICCRYPVDALDRICDAFADFGDMLKIEVGRPKHGISPKAQSAVIQAYFGDPDYLRGTLLTHRFMLPEEADAAMTLTLPWANELYRIAKEVDDARAYSNLLAVETSLQWLCDKARLV